MKALLHPLLCLLLLAACRTAPHETHVTRPLFDGRSLAGWVAVNTAPSTWTVVDGMLHCSGKPTGELRTARMYQNFILEVEWRHLVPGGNAGIFVWADDLTARGRPFHRSVEVQVLDHAYGNTEHYTTHGDIFPIHGARMTPINGRGGSRAFPTDSRSRPSPEWNHYRITCFDGAITLAVNGEVVTRGYDASPRKGYICLESEGGVVDYKNLRILELPDTPVAPEDVAIADRGYESLYSGVDLSGWRTDAPEAWKVRDWILAFEPSGSSGDTELVSEESFGDFRFLYDVRVREGWASGAVKLRGSDAAAISLDPRDPSHGALFEAGWNRFEGTLIGDRLTLELNGRTLLREHRVPGVVDRGPLVLAPGRGMEFANVFVGSAREE